MVFIISQQATIIDLMRHGEPEGGRAYRGHRIDDPLSDKGWQQMWAAIGDQAPWSQIITSPMRRCSEFARAVADKYTLPVTVEHDLREVGFGEWEGRTPDEIQATNLKEYQDFYLDPVNQRPAGAEDLPGFISRVDKTYQQIVRQYQAQHILIVAHAGVNRAIIGQALHAAPLGLYRIKVNNAGLTRLKHDSLGSHLLYHNVKLADMA